MYECCSIRSCCICAMATTCWSSRIRDSVSGSTVFSDRGPAISGVTGDSSVRAGGGILASPRGYPHAAAIWGARGLECPTNSSANPLYKARAGITDDSNFSAEFTPASWYRASYFLSSRAAASCNLGSEQRSCPPRKPWKPDDACRLWIFDVEPFTSMASASSNGFLCLTPSLRPSSLELKYRSLGILVLGGHKVPPGLKTSCSMLLNS